jgi:hypothetical protein
VRRDAPSSAIAFSSRSIIEYVDLDQDPQETIFIAGTIVGPRLVSLAWCFPAIPRIHSTDRGRPHQIVLCRSTVDDPPILHSCFGHFSEFPPGLGSTV